MKPDFIQSEIDRIAALPGTCDETLTLLALAKEAQQTATMPDLQRLQRAEQMKEIDKLHPGNRFRLMFGQSLLPEPPSGQECPRSSSPPLPIPSSL